MIQVLDKYGNTSTDDGRVVIIDKFGNIKKPVVPTGTVTSILTASPITGGPITTTGTIGITQATTSSNGYLSSTDWNTFNSKFNFPALTNGSVLFSNGTTIAENNTNFYWNNTTNTLILDKPSVQGASLTANGIIAAGAISLVPANNTISIGSITAATTSGSGIFYGSSQNTLNLRTLSITRLYINNLGDIGIGTTAPSTSSKINIDLGTFSGTKDGIAIDGNCANNPGSTGIRFSLLNTTANASGFIRMVRGLGTTYLGMEISSQSRDGITFLTDTVDPVERMRLTANGNLLLGTTSDNSSKLNVQGTITASSAIARGVSFNNTLVASANNDVLVGLDINPTFTNGAFAGVTNAAIRVAGNIIPSADVSFDLGTSSRRFNSVRGFQSIFTYYYSQGGTESHFGSSANNAINFPINNIVYGRFAATTGNFLIQSGGPFTDDGVNRLQVTGSAKITNGLAVTGSLKVNNVDIISTIVAMSIALA